MLEGIEMSVEATGETCPSVGPQGIPVVVVYHGMLTRVGAPLRNLGSGGHFEASGSDRVEFFEMPEVGRRFVYNHPVWDGCYSTPITELENSDG